MKQLIFSLTILLSGLAVSAQKPEPIYSFATILRSMDYYKEQSALWKKEIDKDNNNSFAWFNYYRANRNYIRTDATHHIPWKEQTRIETNIVDEMGKAVPNSFEYNLCRWMISGNNYKDLNYLKKAAELGKNRPEILTEMTNWGEIDRNIDRRDEYAKKMFESDLASPGFLNYNYNVIIGLKPNAIIFSCGDNDTYPIWQLQSQGIRKDVTLLNLSLLSIDDYRDKIFKELRIPKWDTSGMTKEDMQKPNANFSSLIKHIALHSGNHPVYVALTVDPAYSKAMEENLYLTGMAYEYNNGTPDNMALLQKNFEQLYALDYLDKPFYKDISAVLAKCLDQNYIVPMLKLYDHYKESGDKQKQEWIKTKIIIIAKGTEGEQEIKMHLDKN